MEEDYIEVNGIELVNFGNGYTFVNTNKVELEGRTKVASDLCGDDRDWNLETTIENKEPVPLWNMIITKYDKDTGFDNFIGKISDMNIKYEEIMEKLDVNKEYTITGKELKSIIGEEKCGLYDFWDLDDIKDDDKLDIDNTETKLVYNTSFEPEINEKLLSSYFNDMIYRFDDNFIECHLYDLLECFRGKEGLINFVSKYGKDYWDIDRYKKELSEKIDIIIERKKILKKLRETKTVVTHFGDDLDNKASIYYLEQWAKEKGILEENENLIIERVPAGKVKEGMLNVDTGGHKGSIIDGDTIVIDGDPENGISSTVAELAKLKIELIKHEVDQEMSDQNETVDYYIYQSLEMPKQIIELADTIPNRVNPLESRTALSLIRNATGEQIFKIAKAGLLDKALTDEQLEEYGLLEEQKKQQEIIDNAVEKINKYTKELATGEKVVIAPEQILAGSAIAYELGVNYYGSVQAHKSGKGSTFAVNSKPGVKLPETIQKFGEELVEQYKNEDGTSGVFLNPNGQMLVAGGPKNPDFAVEIEPEKLIEKLNEQFKEYEIAKTKEDNAQYTSQEIVEKINPRKGEIEEVITETAELAKQEKIEKEEKSGQTQVDE